MNGGYIGVSPVVLYAMAIVACAFVGGVVYNLMLSRRLQGLLRRQKLMLQMTGTSDLDAVVGHVAARLEKVESKLDSIAQAYAVMAQDELAHVRTPVVLRYDAFERQGGQQSFTMALLDARGNGAIITSLYGANENRVYAKALTAAKSEIALSPEEQRALEAARP